MCGLFGFVNYSGKEMKGLDKIIELLGKAAAVRGTDATGISYNLEGKLVIDKAAKSAYQFKFDVPTNAKVVMGHTRKTTQGNQKNNYNNHPFSGEAGGVRFSLAHNGVIHNDVRLRTQLELAKPKIETDSYVAVQLIEKYGHFDNEGLKYAGELLEGMFSLTLMDEHNNWFLVKSDSPLIMLHFPDLKCYAYASTQSILFEALLYSSLSDELLKPFKEGVVTARMLEPKAGEIWKINGESGELTKYAFTPKDEMARTYRYSAWDDYGYNNSIYGTNYKYKGNYEVATKTAGAAATRNVLAGDTTSKGTLVGNNSITDTEYLSIMFQVAKGMGIPKEHIVTLKAFGYTLDEIEAAIYDGTVDILMKDVNDIVKDTQSFQDEVTTEAEQVELKAAAALLVSHINEKVPVGGRTTQLEVTVGADSRIVGVK